MRIVFHSFAGRYSDNPRAIHERLADRPDLEMVWLAEQAHVAAFPDDTKTVDPADPGVPELLASADVVVANTHTEFEWDKRPGTTYLQTWHGTPLKRIHNDVLWAPEGRLARLDRDVARWDLLLSPNPVSTPRLAGAFGYRGRIAETGYPRNDALLAPGAEAVRERTRADMGLTDRQTAVLYAPTWRDHEVFGGDGPLALPLDVAALRAILPDDVVLLVRGHNMVTGRLVTEPLPRVLDVSYHSDIRDLYLAADALVTDYSSVMFDFAVTGKPMLFSAPDLDEFARTIRGFYFDLGPVAPGPMTTSVEELAAALTDLPGVASEHAEKYAAFRSTFCGLEDGHAVDRVLELLGLA
jgi:CDP-glycerol glycerophosphotransferase